MIRFCYSPDGNYDLQTLPDRIESFLIDKKNQKLRVFDTEDFYFSVLDSSYIDSSNPSVGLSMLGANRLYNELDLLAQTFDNYVNDNDAEIYAINEHLAISDGSIIKTNSSVSDLEFRIGQFNFNKNYIYAVNSSDGDSELDIADGQGNVIVRLDDGHIQTKYFDSSWVLNEIEYIEDNAVMNALTDTPYSDLDIVDPSGNVILRLNEGHIQTKNFNSIDCSEFDFDKDYPYTISHVYSQKDESDFDLADSSGNVLVRFVNGHIKTKNFDSEDIDSMNASIISYIDTKDQEVLSDCLDKIDDISKTVDVLQEDYRNYKIQIETDFTNFKNDVNAENSSFREKFENYWIECEEIVTEAMTDLSLQIQTLDSSFRLAISDFVNSSIISYIDTKDQEVLSSCTEQIDDISKTLDNCKNDVSAYKKEVDKLNSNFIILNDNVSTYKNSVTSLSKTVDDCKNDVSVYKKEFDKLNSNFNILNDNVSTYKNSVTSLQEDYRSYKIQINTDFTNFKNNINAENSSFRESFESYWIECEQVVAEAMTDLDLKIQTLDSSFRLAISDFVNSSIISYIDTKDQEVLSSCLDEIDNISKTVDDCKNDVSVYKKEVDNLNDNFNILNDNVSTYKNSVTSLSKTVDDCKKEVDKLNSNFVILNDNVSTYKNSVTSLSKTVDDCKNDVSVYKKEFDKLNSNFNILNDNVSTYKNSVTSLQEDYRSYKTQIETAFANFKNNVNSENSSFREKFESYWIECEEVVTEAMTDLSLQIQTLNSSVNLAISDLSLQVQTLDSSVNSSITNILNRLDALENNG